MHFPGWFRGSQKKPRHIFWFPNSQEARLRHAATSFYLFLERSAAKEHSEVYPRNFTRSFLGHIFLLSDIFTRSFLGNPPPPPQEKSKRRQNNINNNPQCSPFWLGLGFLLLLGQEGNEPGDSRIKEAIDRGWFMGVIPFLIP